MREVDVIIPVYKPDHTFLELIRMLDHQTIPINKIHILNTEQKYFERLIYGTHFLEQHRNITVTHLSRREFDHGGTRRKGVERSSTPFFVMMTQDAVPADEYLLERLLGQLEAGAAVAYARQLPAADCRMIERYTRAFNYPEQSRIKSREDLAVLGIKTYFCSNVCAAYRRDVYDSLGGFVKHAIFNEDMIYAATAIGAGHRIAYEAAAEVIHSHNYNCRQQFHRNFDIGVSHTIHREIFEGIPSEKEGIHLLRRTEQYLKQSGNRRLIPYLYLNSAFKYAGFWLGKRYRRLPMKLVRKWSLNPVYWEQLERRSGIRK